MPSFPDIRRPRLSRRTFLGGMAAAGAAAVVARPTFGGGEVADGFYEPPVRRSVGGVLETTMEARLGRTSINGQVVTSRVYEGLYPGPTMRLRPGDTMLMRLRNRLPEVTNFHWHGFHTSPSGNSDNVLLLIEPGQDFDYRVEIPGDHHTGLYWYHAHAHHYAELQIWSGMVGAIIVEGAVDELPGIAGLRDRVMILQTTEITPEGAVNAATNHTGAGSLPRVRTINGRVNPTLAIRPGETQRFRFLNANADDYCLLSVEAHDMWIIGIDGIPVPRPWSATQMLVPNGTRVEFLLRGGAPGRYRVRSLRYENQFAPIPEYTLATLEVTGDAVEPRPFPTTTLPLLDMRTLPVARQRTLVFDVDFPRFTIDGKVFDPERVDTTVRLDTCEEWLLINRTTEDHPFHIHVNDFQVVAINGQPVEFRNHNDVVNIPKGGSVTVRQYFRRYTGKAVYHCHILFHEDSGMMQVFDIVEG